MKELVKVAKAISDPNRIKILKMLQHRSLCVCEIQAGLKLAQPTVSKHLKILENAGLIVSWREGPWVNNRLEDRNLNPYAAKMLDCLKDWLEDDPEVTQIKKALPMLRREELCKNEGRSLMILTGYSKEIFRPECNPSFSSLHCIARLNEDVREVLPYLNTVLGGFAYTSDPPSVLFKVHGKLITVHGDKIAINALKDEEEADRILEWLKKEINAAWADRDRLTPSFQAAPRPQVMEILKLLPRNPSCHTCGQPSCLVMAHLMSEGAKGPADCSPITPDNLERLETYLRNFNLEQ